MCADRNSVHRVGNGKNDYENGPLNVAVTIDINDIYDGALKVLKRIRPFWPLNNVKFKVGFIKFFNIFTSTKSKFHPNIVSQWFFARSCCLFYSCCCCSYHCILCIFCPLFSYFMRSSYVMFSVVYLSNIFMVFFLSLVLFCSLRVSVKYEQKKIGSKTENFDIKQKKNIIGNRMYY